mgnify:CR=1 FL=1
MKKDMPVFQSTHPHGVRQTIKIYSNTRWRNYFVKHMLYDKVSHIIDS